MVAVTLGLRFRAIWTICCLLSLFGAKIWAQSCQMSNDMDPAVKTALSTAGQRFFDLAVKGDVASMRQQSIPVLASDFSGVESAVKGHEPELIGAQGSVKALFLLNVQEPTPNQRAEFYCGVFGKNGQTADSAAFYFDNLAAGKYAVVLVDGNSAKGRTMFSEVLQQTGTDWKLGGLYIKSGQIAGHDADWFRSKAREFKAKGEPRNAWLYFRASLDLVSRGMNFMGTQLTDRIYDEVQSVQPSDLPANGNTFDLAAGTATYKLSAIYAWTVGDDLDLFVKHQVADVSNTNQAYQDNLGVIKAVIAKYPEFKNAFTGVEAFAVDPNGRNYGTLLAMKDIK